MCFVRFHEVNLVDIGIPRNTGGISFPGLTAFLLRSFQPSVHLCGSRLMPKIQYHQDHWRIKGGAWDSPPLVYFFFTFMQFSGKLAKIIGFGVVASQVWEILDPPLTITFIKVQKTPSD